MPRLLWGSWPRWPASSWFWLSWSVERPGAWCSAAAFPGLLPAGALVRPDLGGPRAGGHGRLPLLPGRAGHPLSPLWPFGSGPVARIRLPWLAFFTKQNALLGPAAVVKTGARPRPGHAFPRPARPGRARLAAAGPLRRSSPITGRGRPRRLASPGPRPAPDQWDPCTGPGLPGLPHVGIASPLLALILPAVGVLSAPGACCGDRPAAYLVYWGP